MARLYEDFGDVFGLEFGEWWLRRGRKLFAETSPLKKVRKIDDRHQLDGLRIEDGKLLLEVPLTLRKQTAMRQIGRILKEAYAGRVIDIMAESTAKRMIVKSKMRMDTVERLLTVLAVRKKNPRMTLYEVGLKAGIELDLLARSTQGEEITPAMERRRMTLAVARYLEQAKNLVTNAGLGIFPSIKKPTSKL